MSDEKVIQAFPPKPQLPENPVELVEDRWNYCQHKSIRIITADRQVVCRECGATLDPFNYLLSEARAIAHGWQKYREVMALTSQRIEEIAKLEKEKKRLQGQVRNLKRQADEVTLDVRRPL